MLCLETVQRPPTVLNVTISICSFLARFHSGPKPAAWKSSLLAKVRHSPDLWLMKSFISRKARSQTQI